MASADTNFPHGEAAWVQLCCRARECLCLPRQIGRAAVQHAGRYTCQAPGHPEKHYNLDVWGKGTVTNSSPGENVTCVYIYTYLLHTIPFVYICSMYLG